MTEEQRSRARELAQKYLLEGDPLGWFEVLYAQAGSDFSIVPWADLAPNPNIVDWLERGCVASAGRKALKIGCGLGDDAEELSRRGFETTAFDISETAISWCRRRHPDTSVLYTVADLFKTPSEWAGKFDFVLESYTLQVLPRRLWQEAMRHIAEFVAPQGMLLVITRGREPNDPKGKMPWPLTREEMAIFKTFGLEEVSFEDYTDSETPPVRRFRAAYKRR